MHTDANTISHSGILDVDERSLYAEPCPHHNYVMHEQLCFYVSGSSNCFDGDTLEHGRVAEDIESPLRISSIAMRALLGPTQRPSFWHTDAINILLKFSN